MQTCFPRQVFNALCFILLAFSLSSEAIAQHGADQPLTQRDLSAFRIIAQDTLAIVDSGNLGRAKLRIKDLEADWDRAEATLRPRSPEQWRDIDKAIDAALQQLRAVSPHAAAARQTLQNLLASFDRPRASTAANADAAVSAKLSIANVIAALEKLRADESVLDVSFEPKDGRPAYAVRTYANGKVWDGLIDGNNGAAIGDGTVTDETALDEEDRAELAALKHAKVTLRKALETSEKANDGHALNAGLEQVRGRVVWEILFQDATRHHRIHIDPITGRIL
ncbi:MAG: hypothetical protein NVS2B16_35980 [Chloroflexota bacterium]